MVKMIDPRSKIKFVCRGQSFMKTPGELVSLVETEEEGVQMICYNQAKDTITTITTILYYVSESDSDSDYGGNKTSPELKRDQKFK